VADLKDRAERPGRAALRVSGARASAALRAAPYASWGTRHVDTEGARAAFKAGSPTMADMTAGQREANAPSTNIAAFFKVRPSPGACCPLIGLLSVSALRLSFHERMPLAVSQR